MPGSSTGGSIKLVERLDGTRKERQQITEPAARAGQPVEGPIAIGVRRQQLRAKVGETRFAFLEEQLKRAGLFFYAGADERVFILTTVHATQAPFYSLIRRPFLSDVKLHRFRNQPPL